jgi:hypothetical protein
MVRIHVEEGTHISFAQIDRQRGKLLMAVRVARYEDVDFCEPSAGLYRQWKQESGRDDLQYGVFWQLRTLRFDENSEDDRSLSPTAHWHFVYGTHAVNATYSCLVCVTLSEWGLQPD